MRREDLGPEQRVRLRRTCLVDGQLLRSVMYTVGAREVTSTPENGTRRGEKHDASRKGAVVPRRGGACAPKRAAQIKAAVSVLWQRSLILELVHSVRWPSAWEVRCRCNAWMRYRACRSSGGAVKTVCGRESYSKHSRRSGSVGYEAQNAHAGPGHAHLGRVRLRARRQVLWSGTVGIRGMRDTNAVRG